jgi:hypothetical protein
LRWSFVGLSAELVGDKVAHDIQIFLETDKLDFIGHGQSQWLLASFRTAHGISSKKLYFSEPRMAAVNISLIVYLF